MTALRAPAPVAVAAAFALLPVASTSARAADDDPALRTAWRVPTAVAGTATGLAIAGAIVAASLDPFDSDDGSAGAIAALVLPAAGGAIGYLGGRGIDRTIARGEEPTGGAKAGARASTVILGAGVGAAVGGWIISHDDDSRNDRDHETVWTSVGVGAAAGALVQWTVDRHLSPTGGPAVGLVPRRDGLALAVSWTAGESR